MEADRPISIHALREESDITIQYADDAEFRFQSTLSVRRATPRFRGACPEEFISIHALREESDQARRYRRGDARISIHALREESDTTCGQEFPKNYISIHALREESDGALGSICTGTRRFQSTLSVRRATWCCARWSGGSKFQSTLSVRRAT